MSAEHTYKFNVAMHCGGCSGAVERVLKKIDGVKSYKVSLEEQTAEVITEESVDYQIVLEKITKTGKKVKSGEADGKEMSVELLPVEPRPVEPLPVEAVA